MKLKPLDSFGMYMTKIKTNIFLLLHDFIDLYEPAFIAMLTVRSEMLKFSSNN